MGPLSRLSIVFALLAPCSGCYRAAKFEPKEIRQLNVNRGSAEIVYRNGYTRRIAEFDSLIVRTNGPALESTPADPPWRGEPPEIEFEFDPTTQGSLSPPLLRLQDQNKRRVFSLDRVQEVTLEKYSPARPWLILTAASIGAIAGGLLGYSMAGPCNEQWGCAEQGGAALLGVPIGIGVGLALGIPLTRGLGDLNRGPVSQTTEP